MEGWCDLGTHCPFPPLSAHLPKDKLEPRIAGALFKGTGLGDRLDLHSASAAS